MQISVLFKDWNKLVFDNVEAINLTEAAVPVYRIFFTNSEQTTLINANEVLVIGEKKREE